MKVIRFITEKEVVCVIDASESTRPIQQCMEEAKQLNLIPTHNEVRVDVVNNKCEYIYIHQKMVTN